MGMTVEQLIDKLEWLRDEGCGDMTPSIEVGGAGGVEDIVVSQDQMNVWVMTTDEA